MSKTGGASWHRIQGRQADILEYLTQLGDTGATASEINNSLDLGVTLKTIQRDLYDLERSESVSQRANESSRAFRWVALPEDSTEPAQLSSSQLKSAHLRLGIIMLFSHAKHLLHESALEGLDSFYKESLDALKRDSRFTGDWKNKVVTSSQHYHLLPAKVDPEHLRKVQSALLEGCLLQVSYFSTSSQQIQQYEELHPLGLSYQDSKIYLVCHTGDSKQKPRTLALHRFRSVELRDNRPVEIPPNFTLSDHAMQITVQPEPIQLQLRISQKLRNTLDENETPFAEQQTIEPLDEEWSLLTATVPYTQGLKWWVLAHGSTVEVLEPPSLRQEVAQILHTASRFYEDPQSQ